MLSIFDIFRKFSSNYEDDPSDDPVAAAALKLVPGNLQLEMMNLATGFICWWRCRERTIWRIRPETAGYLSNVGLYFLPEYPPPSWKGNAIVVESENKGQALFDRYFSVMAYRTVSPSTDDLRYYFVCLDLDGGLFNFSIKADLGRFERDKDILDIPFLQSFGYKGMPDAEEQALKTIRFVFSTSYYIENPKKVRTKFIGGPIKRNKKGKPIKKNGKVQNIWRYADLSISLENRSTESETERGPLDKSGLNLEPVIVSPHIRLHNGKVVIVDAYSSHRWKKSAVGTKKTV